MLPQQGPARSKVTSRTYLSLCCLLPCLSLGCQRAVPEAEKAPPATVKWEGPQQLALEEWTELVGTTVPLPDHVARVSAPVGGKVVWVFGGPPAEPVKEGQSPGKRPPMVKEGQHVEKNTVLVQLDTTVIQADLAKAEAGQQVLRQEEQQAHYAVDQADSELKRLRKLKAEEDARGAGERSPLVSPVDLFKAEYALKDAQSKLKATQARIVAGDKEKDSLRAQMNLLTLSAPIPGELGRLQVVQGQALSAGATVADIVDLSEWIDVLCFVPPSLLSRLEENQQAFAGPIEKAAGTTEPEADGQVVYIARQAEPETGNFAVKVRFNNKDAHLRANRVLRIRVQTQPVREGLSLREAAVNQDEEIPTVVIVEDVKVRKNADGKEETVGTARVLKAKLGVHDRVNHQIEIVGLEDADPEAKKKWQGQVKDQLFVVEGGQGLKTDDKVKLEVEGD